MPGEMSRDQAAQLIAKLRNSEVRKSRCGVRLLKLYDDQSNR